MTENIKKRRRRDNDLTMDAYSKHATLNDFCEAAANENNLQKLLSLKKYVYQKEIHINGELRIDTFHFETKTNIRDLFKKCERKKTSQPQVA